MCLLDPTPDPLLGPVTTELRYMVPDELARDVAGVREGW